MGFIWDAPPTEVELASLTAAAKGTDRHFKYLEAKQSWAEEYTVDGVKIDVGHWTRDVIHQIVADVVDCYDSNFEKQTTVAVLLSAITLHGAEVVEGWRKRAIVYPPELAQRIIAENLRAISPYGSREMLAERDEIPLLYENHCGSIRRLLVLLTALNHTYYSSFKWTRSQSEGWAVSPRNFFERVQNVFRLPAIERTRELRCLMMESFDLIEARYPSDDLAAARQRFAEPYHVWDIA